MKKYISIYTGILTILCCLFLSAGYYLYPVKNIVHQKLNPTKETIHIFFNIDNNYAKYMAVTIASILTNTENPLSFHILHSGISLENMDKILKLKEIRNFDIEFTDFNMNLLKSLPEYKFEHIKKESAIRIFIPFIFKNFDKYIYLDADLIMLHDINELWETDLDSFYIAAVKDPYIKHQFELPNNTTYINAGVLVVNAKLWRQNHIDKKFEKIIQDNFSNLPYLDQDIINLAFLNKIKILPDSYNAIPTVKYPDVYQEKNAFTNPRIIHWAGWGKPWRIFNIKYSDLFWKYAKMTDFYFQIRLDMLLHPHIIFES